MNLANKITVTRILLIPLFMIFLLSQRIQPFGSYIAAVIFSIAAFTDTVDGYVARFQKRVTVFGQILDPLADKLLISAALIALVELARLSAWIALVIIAREFAVSGLRLMAVAENKIIVPSSLGKLKTLSQIIAVIAIILNLPIFIAGKSLGWVLMAIAVVFTIISGMEYFMKAKGILEISFLSNSPLGK